jgi:hypothetical protein
MYGWSFIPTTDIYVTQLGVLDYNNIYLWPKTGLHDSHPVGIWKSSDPSNLLVSATVSAGTSATLIDHVRYQPVVPALLTAGTEYVIGAYYPLTSITDSDAMLIAPYNGNEISTDPNLLFVKRRYLNNTSGLTFPTKATTDGISVGPTFQFIAVPEPPTIALLLTACIGGLLWWRRQ